MQERHQDNPLLIKLLLTTPLQKSLLTIQLSRAYICLNELLAYAFRDLDLQVLIGNTLIHIIERMVQQTWEVIIFILISI